MTTYFVNLAILAKSIENKETLLTTKVKNNITAFKIKKQTKPKMIPDYESGVKICTDKITFDKGKPEYTFIDLAITTIQTPPDNLKLAITTMKYKRNDEPVKQKTNLVSFDGTGDSCTIIMNTKNSPKTFVSNYKILQNELARNYSEMVKTEKNLTKPLAQMIWDYISPVTDEYPEAMSSTHMRFKVDFGKWSEKYYIDSLKGKQKTQVLERFEVIDATTGATLVKYRVFKHNGAPLTMATFAQVFRSLIIHDFTLYDFKFAEYTTSKTMGVNVLASIIVVEVANVDHGTSIEITDDEVPSKTAVPIPKAPIQNSGIDELDELNS